MLRTSLVTRFAAVVALVLLASFSTGFRYGNNAVQAKWTTYVIHNAAGEADIHFVADIPGGWRMYSQNMAGVDGPMPTTIEFDPDPAFTVVGAPKETGKMVSFYENSLGMEVSCIEGKAHYIQHITYKEDKTFSIKCVINYMLNRDGEILPPDDEDFTITIQP